MGKDESLFEEKRTNIKYKKGNRVYTIYGGDYKRKLDPNPYTNLVFYASPRLSNARLVTILIFCLILPPQ